MNHTINKIICQVVFGLVCGVTVVSAQMRGPVVPPPYSANPQTNAAVKRMTYGYADDFNQYAEMLRNYQEVIAASKQKELSKLYGDLIRSADYQAGLFENMRADLPLDPKQRQAEVVRRLTEAQVGADAMAKAVGGLTGHAAKLQKDLDGFLARQWYDEAYRIAAKAHLQTIINKGNDRTDALLNQKAAIERLKDMVKSARK